jgi:hypothetical protein
MKLVAENRHELWASFGLVVVGFLVTARVPMHYWDVLILCGCLLTALFCAINATLDIDAMGIPGKFFSVIWLVGLFPGTIRVLVWAFGISDFANK